MPFQLALNTRLKGFAADPKGTMRCAFASLLFADDSVILLGDVSQRAEMVNTIHQYEKASGAKVNASKSSMVPVNCANSSHLMDMGFPILPHNEHIRHIGYPFNHSGLGLAEHVWPTKIQAMQKRTNLLSSFSVAIPIRILLFKSMVLSMVNFLADLVPPDKASITEMNKMMWNYIWHG